MSIQDVVKVGDLVRWTGPSLVQYYPWHDGEARRVTWRTEFGFGLEDISDRLHLDTPHWEIVANTLEAGIRAAHDAWWKAEQAVDTARQTAKDRADVLWWEYLAKLEAYRAR